MKRNHEIILLHNGSEVLFVVAIHHHRPHFWFNFSRIIINLIMLIAVATATPHRRHQHRLSNASQIPPSFCSPFGFPADTI